MTCDCVWMKHSHLPPISSGTSFKALSHPQLIRSKILTSPSDYESVDKLLKTQHTTTFTLSTGQISATCIWFVGVGQFQLYALSVCQNICPFNLFFFLVISESVQPECSTRTSGENIDATHWPGISRSACGEIPVKLLKVNKAQIVYPPDATLLLPAVPAF